MLDLNVLGCLGDNHVIQASHIILKVIMYFNY